MSLLVAISLILTIIGAIFALLGAIGMLRMPDFFLRTSTATKAATLGAGLVLLAAAIFFGELGIASRAIATIFFLFLTGPVAAHRIARAAYFDNCPTWFRTHVDELRGRYDTETHQLESIKIESEEANKSPV